MSISPSNEQQAVIDFLKENQDDNVAVLARAGSGKTRLLKWIGEAFMRDKIVATSFAQRNTRDLEQALPYGNVTVGTSHSFCYRNWKSASQLSCKLNKKKNYQLANLLNISIKTDFPDFGRCVSFLKQHGMVPFTHADNVVLEAHPHICELTSCSQEAVAAIFEKIEADYGSKSLEEAIELVQRALGLSVELALGTHPELCKKHESIIDFDDMIYLSACFTSGQNLPHGRLILVDEAQDMNLLNHEMLRQIYNWSDESAGKAPQIIIVGDPHQAIYAFRGADASSFELLQHEFDCRTFPLTVSFRCATSVIQEAQKLIPDIKAARHEPGTVDRFDRLDVRTMAPSNGETIAILCRNTLPLISLFYRLIAEGLPAKVIGTDIGQSLINIVKGKVFSKTPEGAHEELRNWSESEQRKAASKGHQKRVDNIQEKYTILEIIRKHCEAKSYTNFKESMIIALEDMFTNDIARVSLSTIHKAKGFEWNTVFFLDDFLIPSKWARQKWELQQESNLRYVAVTRAKDNLFYINSRDII